MDEIVARLNSAFREQYGLTRDVFYVGYEYASPLIALVDGHDVDVMNHFALDIEHLCAVYAEHEGAGQLRMF